MAQTSYCVGIDLGTTYSAAAVYRDGETRPETVPLGGSAAAVASMVFIAPDGSMLCGEAALRRAITEPRQVVREFKRRIGDDTPLIVGGSPVVAEAVAARFVAWILERVAEREGGPARRVTLTHPAEWGGHKRDAVATALAAQGVGAVSFLSEPEAAAIGYASTERLDAGATVAVYDLGGGTFDAAVVRKLPDGSYEVAGKPVGIERLGGVDFDEAVFDHVRTAVGDAWDELDPADPAVLSAVAALRRECTAAKEALSSDTEALVPVMLPGHHSQVRIGRAEFEEQIRPAVADTVEALRRAIVGAGVAVGDLDAVLMVGGSSRIPLVSQLVSAELGRPIAVDVDPKSVICTGAAVAAHDQADAAVVLVKGPAPANGLASGRPRPGKTPPERVSAPALLPPPARSGASPARTRTILISAAAVLVTAAAGLGVTTLSTGFETSGANAEDVIAGAGPNGAAPVADLPTSAAPTPASTPTPEAEPLVLAADQRPATRSARTGVGAAATTGARSGRGAAPAPAPGRPAPDPVRTTNPPADDDPEPTTKKPPKPPKPTDPPTTTNPPTTTDPPTTTEPPEPPTSASPPTT